MPTHVTAIEYPAVSADMKDLFVQAQPTSSVTFSLWAQRAISSALPVLWFARNVFVFASQLATVLQQQHLSCAISSSSFFHTAASPVQSPSLL